MVESCRRKSSHGPGLPYWSDQECDGTQICDKGTIEEKINSIIEEKQALSGELLGSGGEQWITEYSNDELMKIFALGGGE